MFLSVSPSDAVSPGPWCAVGVAGDYFLHFASDTSALPVAASVFAQLPRPITQTQGILFHFHNITTLTATILPSIRSVRGCQYGNHCCVLAVTLHGNCGDGDVTAPFSHITRG